MCGRFARFTSVEQFAGLFGVEAGFVLEPKYNVAPSQGVLAARVNRQGRRELVILRWGLIPFWAKEARIGYSTINARAETVDSKAAFREAFRRRRCLIAADGYYEWKTTERGKQPYFVQMPAGRPFAFAGVWEHWQKAGEVIESCAIIVTAADEQMSHIHDRVPVILSPPVYATWLDPAIRQPDTLKPLLQAVRGMKAYPVSTLVNNPGNEGAALVAESPGLSSS